MNTPKIFVIGPMGKPKSEMRQHTNRLFDQVIQPVLRELKFPYLPAARMMGTGEINAQIRKELHSADIVIADLRGLNPNVMIEVGIRLGVERSCIFLTPKDQDLSFDISTYRTISYPPDLEAVGSVKQQLKKQLIQEWNDEPKGWLYTRKDIEKIEARIQCGNIWVITPDLYHSTHCPLLKAVVQQNLRRGITYTYLFPDNLQTQEEDVLEELKKMFAGCSGQLALRPMTKDEFHKLAVSHYLIFSWKGRSEKRPRVFFELPTKSREYWMEVDREAADDLRLRFLEAANGEKGKETEAVLAPDNLRARNRSRAKN